MGTFLMSYQGDIIKEFQHDFSYRHRLYTHQPEKPRRATCTS
jgi:hypothetical protein